MSIDKSEMENVTSENVIKSLEIIANLQTKFNLFAYSQMHN